MSASQSPSPYLNNSAEFPNFAAAKEESKKGLLESKKTSSSREDVTNNNRDDKPRATPTQEQELQALAYNNESETIIKLIHEFQFSQDTLNKVILTVLLKCSRFQTQTETLSELLITGASHDARQPKDNKTLLMLSIELGHRDFAQHLLEVGADPFLTDKEGANILHYLLISKMIADYRYELLDLVLSRKECYRHNFLQQKRQSKPETPLVLAIVREDEIFACRLLDVGCMIQFSFIDDQNNTILHRCVTRNLKLVAGKIMSRLNLSNPKQLEFLNRKNKLKKTALAVAEEIKHTFMIDTLTHPKKRDSVPNNNWTTSSTSPTPEAARGKRDKTKKNTNTSASYQLKQIEQEVKEKPDELMLPEQHKPAASPLHKTAAPVPYRHQHQHQHSQQQVFMQKQPQNKGGKFKQQAELSQSLSHQQQEMAIKPKDKPHVKYEEVAPSPAGFVLTTEAGTLPLNNHYQQTPNYNRPRSNTNSSGGGWNTGGVGGNTGGGGYTRNSGGGGGGGGDYNHKNQKKKPNKGANNNNLGKPMGQYARYNDYGNNRNPQGAFHRAPEVIMDMVPPPGIPGSTAAPGYTTAQRYSSAGTYQARGKTNHALPFPLPPPVIEDSSSMMAQPYVYQSQIPMMTYAGQGYFPSPGAMETASYTSDGTMETQPPSSPALSTSSSASVHASPQMQILYNTAVFPGQHYMPQFAVPNQIVSSSKPPAPGPSGGGGGPPGAAAPQMSMNLMPEGQQKIKEDYERHQLEVNSSMAKNIEELRAQIEDLLTERKSMHKEIGKLRQQLKNQDRTIQQLSYTLDVQSRHSTEQYPALVHHEQGRKGGEEDNNKAEDARGGVVVSQRSLYDQCEARNKLLQEYGSHAAVVKELPESVELLSKEIAEFSYQISGRMEDNRSVKEKVIKRASDIITKAIHNADVQVYGSHATELCLPWSDIDLVINLPSGLASSFHSRTNLEEVEAQMNECTDFIEQCTLVKAAIPVLKLKCQEHEYGSFQVDITIQDERHNGLRCVSLVKTFLSKYAQLKPLVLILKELLKNSGQNNPFSGGLSSYALTLMVVRHIESRQTGTLGETLLSFLFDYGFSFHIEWDQIEVKPPSEYCSREKNMDDKLYSPLAFNNHGGRSPIIIDPLSASNNVSKSAYNFYYIQKIFARAYYAALDQLQSRVVSALQTNSEGTVHAAVSRALSAQSVNKVSNQRSSRSILEAVVTCASDLFDSEDKYRVLMYNSTTETFEGGAYLPAAMGSNNTQSYGGEYYGYMAAAAGGGMESTFNNPATYGGNYFMGEAPAENPETGTF